MSDAYAEAGVDYETLDAAKRLALEAARSTKDLGARRGAALDPRYYGEPAALFAVGEERLALVIECLGTKSMIAAGYESLTGNDRFFGVGYDTVAAAVNDCCCVGALPAVVNAYFATGAAGFYSGSRHRSLIEGFAAACVESGASWGGGESPTLSGLLVPDGIDLAAAVVGVVPRRATPLSGERLSPGDEIVLVASSGLHTNGASLARAVAEKLPDGLAERLPSGRHLADAVLDRSMIYVGLVDAMLEGSKALHYASHISGHGLRKLMRAERELTYRVEALPEVPEVLAFLAERAGLDAREAYGTLNMGVGFALFVEAGSSGEVVALAERLGYVALAAGEVEEGPRRVVLEPLPVTYWSGELELR